MGHSLNCNKSVNSLPHNPNPEEEAFENIVGKEENAGNQHFLPFPQCFLPIPRRISDEVILSSAIWTSLKICRLVKS